MARRLFLWPFPGSTIQGLWWLVRWTAKRKRRGLLRRMDRQYHHRGWKLTQYNNVAALCSRAKCENKEYSRIMDETISTLGIGGVVVLGWWRPVMTDRLTDWLVGGCNYWCSLLDRRWMMGMYDLDLYSQTSADFSDKVIIFWSARIVLKTPSVGYHWSVPK